MAHTSRMRPHRDEQVRSPPPAEQSEEMVTNQADPTSQQDQNIAVSDPQPDPAPGNVIQAEVNIAAEGGIDPNRQEAAPTAIDGSQPTPISNNTPPPEGVPEPPPVIDRVTVLKQAGTFIADAVAVANWRLTPADANGIEQRLAQLFDEDNSTSAEDLADIVATEFGMSPEWDIPGNPTKMTIQAKQNQ